MYRQLTLPFSWLQARPAAQQSDDEFDPSEGSRRSGATSMWTRVRSMASIKTGAVHVYEFEKDMAADAAQLAIRNHIAGDGGHCLFDPDEFPHKGFDYSLDKHEISEAEAQCLAELATRGRRRFELDAAALESLVADPRDPGGLAEFERLKKLPRWYRLPAVKGSSSEYVNGSEIPCRRRKQVLRRLVDLETSDIISLIAAWEGSRCTLKELASMF